VLEIFELHLYFLKAHIFSS